MVNKSALPDGWAMPDDLARKISESINWKRITPEDEIQDALDEMARDIALIEPNPQDWEWWVSYLLEQMEMQAEKLGQTNQYEFTQKVLTKKIHNRIKGGRWLDVYCSLIVGSVELLRS